MKAVLVASLLIVATLPSCRNAEQGDNQSVQAPEAQARPSPQRRQPLNMATADVNVSTLQDHGLVITDGDGRPLYAFSLDEPNQSNCTKRCTEQFPPKLKEGIINTGARVASDQINTMIRGDGLRQMTFAGRPLYYYIADKAAARSFGQGLESFGGTWHLVRPDGSLVQGSTKL